jgi:hypothetical protein
VVNQTVFKYFHLWFWTTFWTSLNSFSPQFPFKNNAQSLHSHYWHIHITFHLGYEVAAVTGPHQTKTSIFHIQNCPNWNFTIGGTVFYSEKESNLDKKFPHTIPSDFTLKESKTVPACVSMSWIPPDPFFLLSTTTTHTRTHFYCNCVSYKSLISDDPEAGSSLHVCVKPWIVCSTSRSIRRVEKMAGNFCVFKYLCCTTSCWA